MGADSGSGTRRPRLLGIFAHPDDETFCAGGTFARYAQEGAEIMVVSATRGQAGQIRDARVGTRRTIGAVREGELRLACKRLGVAEVRCWDYADGGLAQADFAGLVRQVVQVIGEFRPEAVITFGPEGAYGHPDHITIGAAATAACREAGAPYRPDRVYHSYFPPHDVLLMNRLATWLTTRPERFAGTMDFVHALLLMAEEAVTMRFIRDHAQVHWYPAGCYVVEQGEPATQLFMIMSGHAGAWQELPDGSLTLLRTMGPGEFFGELGVAGRRPRSAHVVATEGLSCLVFSPEAPKRYAGRGEGALLGGLVPGTMGPPEEDAAADVATARLDVTGQIDAKVDALCAYRSQFPLEPGMFPDFLLRELFGLEYFVQVWPPRRVQTQLLT
ncbi:MAG TPA: PIG-L family deacetylase [Streptosporangiaceae bacterium]